jgi:Family of unknown function (DUF6166)
MWYIYSRGREVSCEWKWTEGRKHAVYAMPKQSSSSRKSTYDVPSAAARSGAVGLPTSITSGPLHGRIPSGLTCADQRPAELSIYYGSIIGSERSVGFISAQDLASVHPQDLRTDLHRCADGFRWGDDDPRTLELALALLSFALESEHRAMALHRRFAAEVLMLPYAFEWSFTQSSVLRWAEAAESSLGIVWMSRFDAYREELHT